MGEEPSRQNLRGLGRPVRQRNPQRTSAHYVGIGQDQAIGVPDGARAGATPTVRDLYKAAANTLCHGGQLTIQLL
jgi:hypothetical protein